MKNRIFSLLLLLLLFVNSVAAANAVELPQERTDSCSIEISVQYDGKPIKDGKLTAVLVGYMDQEDYNYFFRTVFKHEEIEKIGSWETVNQMYAFYKNDRNKYDFEEVTVEIKDGKAKFSKLDTGLYLVFQETPSTGYYPISSFLVSVPYWDGTKYCYDVDLNAKTALGEIHPEPTEKKDSSGSGTSGGKPPQKLPQTGQLTWPIPVMIVTGSVLLALGWWLCCDHRKGSR